jgi:hypothetical protein
LNIENNYKDTFVQSDLVHFIVEWASIKYSFHVKTILDNINIQAHLLEEDGIDQYITH